MRSQLSIRYLRVLLLVIAASSACLSTGCATIAHGRNQKIRIETNPPAARISVEGLRYIKNPTPLQFETPGEVVLRRKENT